MVDTDTSFTTTNMNVWHSTIKKILYLSDLDYCQSSEDMQNRLEEINDLIKTQFPNLEE